MLIESSPCLWCTCIGGKIKFNTSITTNSITLKNTKTSLKIPGKSLEFLHAKSLGTLLEVPPGTLRKCCAYLPCRGFITKVSRYLKVPQGTTGLKLPQGICLYNVSKPQGTSRYLKVPQGTSRYLKAKTKVLLSQGTSMCCLEVPQGTFEVPWGISSFYFHCHCSENWQVTCVCRRFSHTSLFHLV